MRFDRAVDMRRWRNPGRRLTVEELAAQFVLDLQPRAPVWVDPDDIPDEGDYPEHRWASAQACQVPKDLGPASIFDMGLRLSAASVISEFTLAGRRPRHHTADDAPVIHRRIVREGSVTRHIAMRVQETDEWAEKERARRARQKLPKPPKQTFKLRKKEAA